MGKASAVRRTAVPHHRGHALRLEPPADAPDPADLQQVRRWVRAAERPTAIDLFCGAGGLSLGLRDAGFSVLVGADSDPLAIETHTGNLGGLGWIGDLTDPQEFLEHLEQWGIRSVDLVAGGPPCQPFSRAGSAKIRDLVRSGGRSAEDPRASLWNSFMTVVARLRPPAVLIENVPDLPTWDNGAVLVGFYESLRELDYEVDARILDAYRHGVPQHRSRLFIVATRGARRVEWPEEIGPAPTLRDAIGDLPPAPPAQRDEESLYIGRPASELARRLRRGMANGHRRIVWDHITRDVRADDHEAFSLMPEGGTYADLPPELQRYRSDIFTDKYKRLSWDEVSRTITAHIAKDGYWYIHPEQPRTLSIREAARVQTFPDDFRFAGQPTHRFRQIGNAVPPLLAEALGKTMRTAIESRSTEGRREQLTSFHDDLLAWHPDHARRFPWRGEKTDPWLVLMAEMCLHRARVDQVATIFEELRRLAPTPRRLLDNEEMTLAAMCALGLNQRVENVIGVARALVDQFDGQVPETELELRTLPAVGDYAAQAVLSFGFGQRAVLIDSNTTRIVGRIFDRDRARRFQLRLDLYRLAGPDGPDAAFNYALLDLGALVCKVGKPRCEVCPVRSHCATGGRAAPPPQLDLEAE
ncbi:MAG TPA: DNA (cytosine-5-)-methyltransferase [Solirubrobacterales bacterium]